jgi:anti-anti-sigma factor
VKVTVDGPVLILTLTVPQILDDVVEAGLAQELLGAVSASNQDRVVVDFHSVVAISSAALGALTQLRGFLQGKSARLVLCSLSPQVAEVFHLTQLARGRSESASPFQEAADLPAALTLLKAS